MNQTYEEKKKMREAEKKKSRKDIKQKKIFMRFLKFFIGAVILALIGYGVYVAVRKNIPQGEDLSVAVPDIGRQHVSVNSATEPYNSNPPTSGQHYAEPARPGFRDESIADGHLIHSMEHGLVWVSYHPRIGAEAEKLRKVPSSSAVIVPREANDTEIAIAAWGRLDVFNLEDGTIDADDLQRIRDFINRYANKGPERIPAGQHGGI